MKRIDSLSDLLNEELADLLSMESQLLAALPKMADAGQSPALKTALENCLKITKGHVKRLDDILNSIGQHPQRLTSTAMKDLLTEIEDITGRADRSPASDAAITSVAQRVQQYEIARYKTVREHAADLGHTKIIESFTKTLDEERALTFYFNELAQGMINIEATEPHAHGYRGKQIRTGGSYE
jgi:ferritin-like metal-binding protein YciE